MRACENCGASLTGYRANARFCGSTCRAAYWKTRSESTRAFSTVERLRNVYSGRRRAISTHRRKSRDGNGRHVYFTPSEIAALIDLLALGSDTRDTPLQGVLAKLSDAYDRLEVR